MANTVKKVVAYITRGDELLVFTHRDSPEAGVQVPAGTVEEGETLDAAVLREVHEETGLTPTAVRNTAFLGRCLWKAAPYCHEPLLLSSLAHRHCAGHVAPLRDERREE